MVIKSMRWSAHGFGLLFLKRRVAAALSLGSLSVFVSSCSSGGTTPPAPPAPSTFTLQLQPPRPVLTLAQRTSLGFKDGPPDGTLGVLMTNGTYSFYGAALSGSTCSGTPGVEGTYRLGGSFTAITAPYGCTALLKPGGDPNGYTFDVNYAGGGPVLPVTSASGQAGVLHVYHGEFHGGTCATGPCTYASLGMAFSKDGGATFQKLGEIVQPYATRAAQIGAGTYTQLGGGTLILADAGGNHIANVSAADPASVYLYVFYYDADPAAAAPCDVGQCLAVARAQLSAVLNAAFAGNTAAFPALFTKYYNNSWTQPGTSGDPNAATNAGTLHPGDRSGRCVSERFVRQLDPAIRDCVCGGQSYVDHYATWFESAVVVGADLDRHDYGWDERRSLSDAGGRGQRSDDQLRAAVAVLSGCDRMA